MFIDAARIPSIGHPLIDGGHKALAETVNDLFEQWRCGAPAEDLRAGFELLLRAIGRHFLEEEGIVRAAGCSGVDQHAAKHRALLEALTAQVHALTVDGAADGGLGDPRIDLFTLIDQMLYEHEILDDQEFWPVLHGQPALAATTFIDWSGDFETGHAEMDRQHRTLRDMINVLAGTIAADGRREDVAAVLGRIVELARCHFVWEERQIEATAAGRLHAVLHRQLLADLSALQDDLSTGECVALAEVPGRLRVWFTDHITHADSEVAAALRPREASPVPTRPGRRTEREWSPPPRAFAG